MEQALSGDLGWHAAMLQDEMRVDWFARAVAALVRPGDVALDLGCGTGLLAMLAARAGARHVYAVEQSQIVEVARELVAANGLDDRVTIVPGLSFDLDLPERAGVVISETLGAWGIDEGIAAIMADARERLAKPDARFIPDGVTMWLALLKDDAGAATPRHLERLGLDYTPFYRRLEGGTSGPMQAEVGPDRLLCGPQEVLTLALGRDDPHEHRATLHFDVPPGTHASGAAGWFSVTAPGMTPLTTEPAGPPTMWSQLVIPFAGTREGRISVVIDVLFGQDGVEIDLQAS